MSKELLNQALEYLEDNQHWVADGERHAYVMEYNAFIDKLKQALAQPEQEPFQPDWANFEEGRKVGRAEALEDGQKPVGKWIGKKVEWTDNPYKFSQGQPIYTSPPQRTWVGLTEDDKVLIKHDANFNQFMTAGEYADRVQALTEARLKDKNT